MSTRNFTKTVVFLTLCMSCRSLAADSMSLIPFQEGDGRFQVVILSGQQQVWQNTYGDTYLYFDVPSSFKFHPGSPVYLKVTYYDEGYGKVRVQYDSTFGNSVADICRESETHTRSSRVDTLVLVDSYHELQQPKFAGRQNGGADFRLSLWPGEDAPLSIQAVTIQNTPFDNPQFKYVLTKPWLGPYTGSTKDYVDRSTLNHKVLVGYQGWFRAPNDLADTGWFHWCMENTMISENFNVDMWPDLTEYGPNELFRAADIVTRSGKPAYLFSSATPETVRRHFQWMRRYNIDGILLSRFITSSNSGLWGKEEWVLHHVREAANLEGRIWLISYDVNYLNMEADPYNIITTDWKWLVDVVKVREDPRYAYEGDKPVVMIWGLPYPSLGFDKTTANQIINFFKYDAQYGGNYVIGGLPWWWRNLTEWYDHIRLYDGALAWMPPDQQAYSSDCQTLRNWGVDYFPHVHPGFSWANMQHQTGNQDYEPRQRGAFFWKKIREAFSSGATRLIIGMFDEYDEGTAIMPMSDDPPNPPPQWGRFITNEGQPSDWWMLLAGEARGILLGQRPDSASMPTVQELSNRSNIGPEAWIDLGANSLTESLYNKAVLNGLTQATVYAGRDCVSNATQGIDGYFSFDVDSRFAYQMDQGLDVTIEVEYCDSSGSVTWFLEYDGIGDAYTRHPLTIRTQGTGEWRTVRFEIDDAYFGNRQSSETDFRLSISGSNKLYIDRIWLRRTESQYFVDINAKGNNDGSSWINAFDNLQDALTVAKAGDAIWVAQGTYTPDCGEGQTQGDRSASFKLGNGISILGGFPPGGGTIAHRHIAKYETILSGNIGDPATNADNSIHVVMAVGCDDSTVLDGLTIADGNADLETTPENRGAGLFNNPASLKVIDCTFRDNAAAWFGAGLYNHYNSKSEPNVIRCTFLNNTVGSNGGAVYSHSTCNPTFTDCLFENNTAVSGGGGAIQVLMGNAILNHCDFVDNSAKVGGAIIGSQDDTTLVNCTFSGNSAIDQGGAIKNDKSTITLTDCTFVDNSAPRGGALFCTNESQLTVKGCMFDGNIASVHGGAVFTDLAYIMIASCTFLDNGAVTNGGAMWLYRSDAWVVNCTFGGNSAHFAGGVGVHVSESEFIGCVFTGNTANDGGGLGITNCTRPTYVTNSTFSCNDATNRGAGLYDANSVATVINSILWANTAAQGPQIALANAATMTVQRCDVQDGQAKAYVVASTLHWDAGNMTDDPCFVDADGADNLAGTEDDRLDLSADSPCIDAGDNKQMPADIADLDNDANTMERMPLDIDGRFRFIDDPAVPDTGVADPPQYLGILDLGAYEHDT